MDSEQLIAIIEDCVPQPPELDFDKIGMIRESSKEIKNIGVCVDLTDYVTQEVREKCIDFLIVHQGRGIEKRVEELNIGAYGLHLALDTAEEEGLIEQFANELGLYRPLGTPKNTPITFEYKGNEVHRGAVLCDLNSPPFSELTDGKYNTLEYYIQSLVKSAIKLSSTTPLAVHNIDQFDRKFGLRNVIVSTGPSITQEFLEQVQQYDPDLFIAGSCKNGAQEYARQLGIVLMTFGNYESHIPGMDYFAKRLQGRLKLAAGSSSLNESFIPAPESEVPSVVFMPNYPITVNHTKVS